jgi:hypothetical protein
MSSKSNIRRALATLAVAGLAACAVTAAQAQKNEDRPKKPPKGAIILFDGKDTSKWVHRGTNEPFGWKLVDGAMEVGNGKPDLMTKEEFGDYQLHVEFMTPLMPDKKSQERGNSGVYNQGRYEIQVLDSYENETYAKGGCGAIYGVKDPDKNVCKPPLQWQTYDITFHAPRFDADGKVLERPRITLVWNGVKVHDNVEIPASNTTAGLGGPVTQKGPILLQNHGCAVRYRNIWIKPLDLTK